MAETEVESMTVKLKGDATSYQKMLQDSAKGATDFGKTANAAWSITEKSFIQAIRSVDAMISRTVASITNGLEGIVRISVAVGQQMFTAWAGVLDKVTLGFSTSVGKWIGSLGSMVGDTASFVNKYLAGIPGAIGTTLFGVSQVVGTVLAGAFGIAAAAVLTFGREMTLVFNETLKLDQQARNLGVTVLDLRAGMLRFGVSAQTLGNALSITQVKLAQFQQGSGSAAKDLKALSTLSGMSVDRVASGWEGIFDAIAAIPDPAQRAAQAFRFMGSSANEMLRELERGGMGDSKGMAKRLGLDVTPADAESLRQISRFTRDVEALKTGLVSQTMLGLAPIAAELTKMFNLSKTDITFIKDMVTKIGLEILKWGAMIATAFTDREAFSAITEIIQEEMLKVAKVFWDFMSARAQEFISRNAYWLNPGMRIGDDPDEVESRLIPATGPQTGVEGFMNRFQSNPILKLYNDLVRGVDSAKGGGAGGGMMTPPVAIEKLTQSFDSMVSSLKQPIDAWKQSLSELKAYTKAGLFTARGDQQAMSAAQMFKQLKEGTGMAGNPMFAGAAAAGSTEAYSAIAQFQALRDRGDIQQQMKTAIEQGNRQREALINNGNAVLQALKAMNEKLEPEEEAEL